jgi:hypothetical protein
MPDNTYVWVVMEEDIEWPVGLFQKKYSLRSWLNRQEHSYVSRLSVLRFPPYGHAAYVEVDPFTIRESE